VLERGERGGERGGGGGGGGGGEGPAIYGGVGAGRRGGGGFLLVVRAKGGGTPGGWAFVVVFRVGKGVLGDTLEWATGGGGLWQRLCLNFKENRANHTLSVLRTFLNQ